MAKRQKDTPQAKHQLSDLRISKVSLVDKPAVPGSVFVIAKRDEEPTTEAISAEKSGSTGNISPKEVRAVLNIPTASQHIEALCKSIGALCERVDKLLEATVKEPVPELEPSGAAALVALKLEHLEKQGILAQVKTDRFKPYAKVLNGLSKRVEKTETTIRNVTGELPHEEE